jgi:hypothetical protein
VAVDPFLIISVKDNGFVVIEVGVEVEVEVEAGVEIEAFPSEIYYRRYRNRILYLYY